VTDFFFSVAAAGGLFVYSVVAVALYRGRTRDASAMKPTTRERAGLVLALLAIYGGVLATLALTTHGRDGSLSWETAVWGVGVGFFGMFGAGTVLRGDLSDVSDWLHAARSALWPVTYPLGWLAQAVGVTAVLAARGTLRAGDWLANLPTRRARKDADKERQRAEREARIAELEKELL
jgi:hypothetical protein